MFVGIAHKYPGVVRWLIKAGDDYVRTGFGLGSSGNGRLVKVAVLSALFPVAVAVVVGTLLALWRLVVGRSDAVGPTVTDSRAGVGTGGSTGGAAAAAAAGGGASTTASKRQKTSKGQAAASVGCVCAGATDGARRRSSRIRTTSK